MRVLISAYACEPEKGSEPEAGLQSLLAAASVHETWLITRSNNVDRLGSYLHNAHPRLAERIHITGIDLPERIQQLKRRSAQIGMYAYYDAWQRRLGREAQRLDALVGFDLCHHATFATYWARVGLSALSKPLVWGPVGGGVRVPTQLRPTLSLKNRVAETVRSAIQSTAYYLSRSPGREARVALFQNVETMRIAAPEKESSLVLPNALAASANSTGAPPRQEGKLLIGSRLVEWKGVSLALRALAGIRQTPWQLDVFGTGPEANRLERLATSLGIRDRVRFMGHAPRQLWLEHLKSAHALIHPSLREEAGMVVVEALKLGTPAVCLDMGGPRALARAFPSNRLILSPVGDQHTTERTMRVAIERVLTTPPESFHPVEPAINFREALLEAYEAAVG